MAITFALKQFRLEISNQSVMSRHPRVKYEYDDYDDYDDDQSSDYSGASPSPSVEHYMSRAKQLSTSRGSPKVPSPMATMATGPPMNRIATTAQVRRAEALAQVARVLPDYAGHDEEAVWHTLQRCAFDTEKCVDLLLTVATATTPRSKLASSASGGVFDMDPDDNASNVNIANSSDSSVANLSSPRLNVSVGSDGTAGAHTPKRDKLKASLSAIAAASVRSDGPNEFDFSSPAAPPAATAATPVSAVGTNAAGTPAEVRLKSSGSVVRSNDTPSRSRPAKIRDASKQRELEALLAAAEKPTADGGKQHVNLIVIGHVDAGKSTINGHLLLLTGRLDQRASHRNEKDAKAAGKGSFALAWALDEHEEERARGVTINVGVNYFETAQRRVTLLDAPGHRDFVPNMISGASQADFAILVVDAAPGQFEVGFGNDGQTKEHALLARSLGAWHVIVAVNKMDAIAWDKPRYDAICGAVAPFLKSAGFRADQVTFVPCSGLTGANLSKSVRDVEPAAAWHTGPTLMAAIDAVPIPDRDAAELAKPLRFCVADVYKSHALGLAAGGRVEAGVVMVGDRVLLSPLNEYATIKAIHQLEKPVQLARAGESVDLGLGVPTGAAQSDDALAPGDVIGDIAQAVPLTRRIRAQVLTFVSAADSITKGYPCDFLMQSLAVPCKVSRLVALIDRATGEVKKARPRLLGENVTAVIEVKFGRAICVEKYANCKPLGRFMLRKGGRTVCAGIVLDIDENSLKKKSNNAAASSNNATDEGDLEQE
jgi:elongation factor 1 alpha-like protein